MSLCPARYAITPNAEKLQSKGPVARPSGPSVKLTALLVPIIIKTPQGMSNNPRYGLNSLKNGIHRCASVPTQKYHPIIQIVPAAA